MIEVWTSLMAGDWMLIEAGSMAKRQKSLREHYFAKSRELDSTDMPSSTCGSSKSANSPQSCTDPPPPSQAELAQGLWREQWTTQFEWLQLSAEVGKVFCKTCKEKGGRSVYAKEGSKNFKVSAFLDHARSNEHRRLSWASSSGEKTMERAILHSQRACDEALMTLFRAAYFIGKQSLPFSKFPSLCDLLKSVKAPITTSMYQDEKACANLIWCISVRLQKKILCRIRNSPFYGIMIDESTDISVTRHLVVFASIVEEGLPVTLFLGLLQIPGSKKDATVIFDTLISHLRTWELDLCKFVAFGSDGASTMVGSQGGVATKIRLQVNPFLISCHCVAHRTNLAALDAAKAPDCKSLSAEVDSLLNSISSFFNKSSKRKHALTALQEEFLDAKKTMKRYHKIRWLSRWHAVTTLCDSLESVLCYFQTVDNSDSAQAKEVLHKLGQFKFIYILFFLADILHSLAMLSKVFQNKFVDVSSIGSIIRSEIVQIRMLFIVESCDLNAATFNEDTGFHLLPEYGPHGGYLKRLQSEIRGKMFHGFEMKRCRLGTDLGEALDFQRAFAEAVCAGLDARFQDNDLITCFKVLNPTNMPSRQVGLQNYFVAELESLLAHFGVDRSHAGFTLPTLVDVAACKREFLSFKLQCTSEWRDKNFRDFWGMITWNHSLQVRYPNLLVLAKLASVQCVSTATCERAFSVQNLIKTRVRNRLGSKHLEAMLRIALEGPDDEIDDVLCDAVLLWKNDSKYRFLYSNPSLYLNGSGGLSMSTHSLSSGALETGASGTEMS